MKVMTILGTRPEIIRLSRIIPLLDRHVTHLLVHTGQNYDYTLNEIFFNELKLRSPDYLLDCKAATAMQEIALILTECERVILTERPDRIVILGDTNSALTAIIAKRYRIPVFHLEAGNRCYDDRVPEEINRRLVDHSSDILLPYTKRSRFNLLKEGLPSHRIFVSGNPIGEVLEYYRSKIEASTVLSQLGVTPRKFFLVTLHRAENVDLVDRLAEFISAFRLLTQEFQLPLICSLHPRTRSQLLKNGQTLEEERIIAMQPLGLFDFIRLEQSALCVLSDSGTVQEECCLMHTPNVTLRDVTERPETMEAGSNLITGCRPESIVNAVKLVLDQSHQWHVPEEYLFGNVSETVVKIVLSALPPFSL